MQAVILAGGKGTRLRERLAGKPKPLVEVLGIPLLERQLNVLKRNGILEVLLLVNHEAKQIEQFIGRIDIGISIEIIDDGAPRGTAGATLACIEKLRNDFFVVYGDTLFEVDLQTLLKTHRSRASDATLVLHPNDHPADSDLVVTDSDDWITAFAPYPRQADMYLRNRVNAALYVIERDALLPYANRCDLPDFAKDLFPAMLAAGAKLTGYSTFEYIKDVGTPARLDRASKHLAEGVLDRARLIQRQKAVFIDRDGTLNAINSGDYIRQPADLELFSGAATAVRRLNDAEFRVVLVSNQPVIARGECTDDDMVAINAKLETLLGADQAFLDAVYICPHHPDRGFPGERGDLKIQCSCRKPSIGMISRGIEKLNVDTAVSWMVGDSTGDMLAGNRAGLTTMLVGTGEGGRDGKYRGTADFTASDLGEAVKLITEVHPKLCLLIDPISNVIASGDVVCIAGPARTGKSSVAAVLRQSLRSRGISAHVIALDRWIRPTVDRAAGVFGRYDLEQAADVLAPWFAGRTAEIDLPFYDRNARQRLDGGSVILPANCVLILEGVPAAALAFSTTRKVHSILMDSNEDGRRDRVVNDLRSRAPISSADAHEIYETRVLDEVCPLQAFQTGSSVVLKLDQIFEEVKRGDYK